MHSLPRPLFQPEEAEADLPPPARLPVPPTRFLSAQLARLRRRRRHQQPIAAGGDSDPRLDRARAVLADAREQMPGLLRPPDPSDQLTESLPNAGAAVTATPAAAIQEAGDSGADGFSRLEAMLVRLEEDRRQLRAEVAALRLIVEELRETLVRVDERTFPSEPDPLALPPAATAALPVAVAGDASFAAEPKVEDETSVRQAGARVEVRLLSADDGGAVEQLRRALEAEPEVERVALTSPAEGEAMLHLDVRSVHTEWQLAALLERAAPTAKLLVPATPGTFLLRLRLS